MRKAGVFGIAKIFGENQPEESDTGWVTMKCPFAPFRHESGHDTHPSFAIKVDDNAESHYNCFSCGSSGDMMDLVVDLSVLYRGAKKKHKPDIKTLNELCSNETDDIVITAHDIPEYDDAIKTPVVDFDFPEWWLEKFPLAVGSAIAQNYLEGRDVPYEVAIALDLRWDAYQERIGFPFRNQEGFVCGMNGRSVHKKPKLPYLQYNYEKHYNLHLWYREDKMDLDKPLLVTESVFDVASIMRVYQNVVAGFTCSFSKEKALRLGDANEIVTLFDAGQGGDRARKRMKDVLGSRIVAQLIPPSDAGEMSIEELEDALEDLVPLSYIDKL